MEETIAQPIPVWSTSSGLTRASAKLFESGDFLGAFRGADRLSRTAEPDARVLLLRARALQRLGRHDAASQDLKEAFALDPIEPLIAHEVLSSDLFDLHAVAARALVSSPHAGGRSLRLAIKTILDNGLRVVAGLNFDTHTLRGWVAWTDADSLDLIVDDRRGLTCTVPLRADRDHRLADPGWNVASVDAFFPRREKPAVRFVAETDLTEVVFVSVLEVSAASRPERRGAPRKAPQSDLCNVIVPVYDDVKTTSRCLAALGRQVGPNDSTRIILVNDRPGDPQMRTLARDASAANRFELIENETNLGFVGSINKALATIEGGDVLLLNSDVILPPHAIERLRRTAHGRSDIGTVTPLTNNGEMTNWPRPLRSNPMPSRRNIEAIDAIAGQVNHERVVPLPCGIGFCLYIRADCLAAVGSLAPVYLRGYLEDVEFCLRARELGFRNVCAANVYVGHMGTRSFKTDKRALVVRNLKVLESRFPDIRADTLAFLQADPISPARAAIESRAVRPVRKGHLVIARVRDDARVQKRVDQLKNNGSSVLTLTGRSFDRPFEMTLSFEGEGIPQSSVFDVTQLKDNSALVAMLRRLHVQKVEVFSDCALPGSLGGLLNVGDFRIQTVVDSYPFSPPAPVIADACEAEIFPTPCQTCLSTFLDGRTGQESLFVSKLPSQRLRPRALSRMAEALFQDTKIAAAAYRPDRFDKGTTPDDEPQEADGPDPGRAEPSSIRPVAPKPTTPRHEGAQAAIAILSPAPTAESERLLRRIAGAALRIKAKRPLVVFGSCLDDHSLLSFPDTAVTGTVSLTEYRGLFDLYDIGLIFAPERWGGFQLIDDLADDTGLPHAYFDWSFGKMARSSKGLALDPRICDAKAARILLDWRPSVEGSSGDRS